MRLTAATVLIFAFSTSVFAQDGSIGFMEITPYGAYSFGGTFKDTESGTTIEVKDSENFGLILNFRQSAETQWELIYSLQNSDAEVEGARVGGVDIHYLQGGGTYQFEGDKVRPFMSATLGGTHIDATADGFGSDTFFGFSIGGGIQIMPTSRIGLRLEARGFGTLIRSGSSIFCGSNPGDGQSGCAITVAGDAMWQLQTMAGIVFRF